MKCIFSFIITLCIQHIALSQSYEDSMRLFIRKYIDSHEVVKGANRANLQFFPVDKSWRVKAMFERKENSAWFMMPTSGKTKQEYRIYGTLTFIIHDTTITLSVYQSKDLLAAPGYSNYLFVPFTDKSSGADTYGGGRYIDLTTADIKANTCVIDFNKAYNPYCAYTVGYNCPIPPKENDLPVTVTAGEKNYLGH